MEALIALGGRPAQAAASAADAASDPNWLLATTAQSTAALVAIVGGLLVSRLVALAGQREALELRIRELDDRISAEAAKGDRISSERVPQCREVFVDGWVGPCVEAVEAGREWDDFPVVYGASKEECSAWASELSDRARLRLSQPDSDDSDGDWIDEKILEHLGSRERKRSRSRETWAIPDFAVPGPNAADSSRALDDRRRRETLHRDELDVRHELRVLNAERLQKRQEVAALRNPRGLWRAFLVLAYFSLVGIIVPMVVMANYPVPAGTSSRRLVIALFASGLLALGTHIVVSVRELRPSWGAGADA